VGLGLTLAILVAAAALGVLANLLERRPRELGNPPLVPYTAIQMVAVVVTVLMLAHLVSLLSGQPFAGRLGLSR
jgi:uncharacterized membrane protein YjjB (DUF3815 family)